MKPASPDTTPTSSAARRQALSSCRTRGDKVGSAKLMAMIAVSLVAAAFVGCKSWVRRDLK